MKSTLSLIRARLTAWALECFEHRYDGSAMQRVVGKAVLSRGLYRLGSAKADSVRLAVLPFELAITRRIPALRERWARVNVSWCGRSLRFWLSDLSELEVLREVLLEEEYVMASASDPATIIDLGSNIGASVLYFRQRYPTARIVAVEADARTARKLEANTRDDSRISVLTRAVAGQDGERHFESNESSWASRLVDGHDGGGRIVATESVTASSLDTLIDELKIDQVDLLKIDVEGAEWEVFESFEHWEKVPQIVGELHSQFGGDPGEFAALLPHHLVEYGGDGPAFTFKAILREA